MTAPFEHPEYRDHEELHFLRDATTGLRAIIAIHRTLGGRSGGGVRFYPYASSADALTDVLRLSRAMTYKCVLTGLPIGGGKSVILGDPRTQKTPALLRAFGREVERLDGRYTCAPDVGTNPDDMHVIREVTSYVTGEDEGGTAPPTALTVLEGMKACVKHALGRDDLAGLTVAVQGVGGVGGHLCGHLHDAGARLIVADINADAVAKVVDSCAATAVAPDAILSAECDILAPCALGAVLNDRSVPAIRARIVCGGANNQLAGAQHADMLHERGIVFAPDYVVNVGGLLGGAAEIGVLDEAQLRAAIARVRTTMTMVLTTAEERGVTTSAAAEQLAEDKLSEFTAMFNAANV
jgi:leucine dehydrogenase